MGFCLPLLLFVAVCASSGIYPFGQTSFLAWDENYQYVDFFSWYKGLLLGDNSIFYTSASGLGADAWGMFGYYLASPLNILILLFEPENYEVFFLVLSALKLSLAGLAMCFFARRRFGLSDLSVLIVGLGYSCSSWAFSQINNILWLDALVLLPVIMWAGYLFANEGKWRLLMISLTAAVIACWYTAYMLFIFGALYIIFELYVRHVETVAVPVIYVIKKASGYAGVIVGSVLLSAWTFLPTINAMITSDTGVESRSLFSLIDSVLSRFGIVLSETAVVASFALACVMAAVLIWFLLQKKINKKLRISVGILVLIVFCLGTMLAASRCSVPQLFAGLVSGGSDIWSTPQVFAGTVILILAISLLFIKEVPAKIRFAIGAFAFLMILCCWNTVLYCIWCGMRVPGGFYCRIGFLAVVPLLWAAAFALKKMEEGSSQVKSVLIATVIVGVISLLASVVCKWVPLANGVFACGLCLLVLLAVWMKQAGKKSATVCFAALLVLLFVDLGFNGTLITKQVHSDFVYTHDDHEGYLEYAKSEKEALLQEDSSVYRFDKTYTRAQAAALGEGLSTGYDSISSYTSAHNGPAINMLTALGYGDQDDFIVSYLNENCLADSLLGLKYISAQDWETNYSRMDNDFNNDPTRRYYRLYENKYALPLAYGVSSQASTFALSSQRNPFEQQNALASSLLGKDFTGYEKLDARVVSTNGTSTTWELDIPQGSYAYVYVQGEPQNVEYLPLYIDGKEYREGVRFYHHVRLVKGEGPHKVTLDTLGVPDVACLFYSIKESDLAEATAVLSKDSAAINHFEDGHVSMSFNASEDDNYLLFTIPDDNGLTVTVNGEEVETESIAEGAMMLIPVTLGDNRIEMNYISPGFIPGVVISIIGLVIFLASCIIRRKQK